MGKGVNISANEIKIPSPLVLAESEKCYEDEGAEKCGQWIGQLFKQKIDKAREPGNDQ